MIDEMGNLLKEAKVPTEFKAIALLIARGGYACKRAGLKAGLVSTDGNNAQEWQSRLIVLTGIE